MFKLGAGQGEGEGFLSDMEMVVSFFKMCLTSHNV